MCLCGGVIGVSLMVADSKALGSNRILDLQMRLCSLCYTRRRVSVSLRQHPYYTSCICTYIHFTSSSCCPSKEKVLLV